jgi:hypothetical protein
MTTALQAPKQTQRKMLLDDRPTLALATVETARHALPGHDEDDILALVEEGQLLYAWNIAACGDEGRRELRIYPECIEHLKNHPKKGYPKTEHQVAAAIRTACKGGDKPFVTGRALRLVLNCGINLITDLLNAKALSVLPGTSWTTGPNGSALITVESLEQFLKERRV